VRVQSGDKLWRDVEVRRVEAQHQLQHPRRCAGWCSPDSDDDSNATTKMKKTTTTTTTME
jgi:hypothetical protein